MTNHYHYIITGAGCAGSSLLMRIMREPFFADKKILVIDKSPKTDNDRTWCFWEKEPGIFQSIVYHQWDKLNFFSEEYSATLDITPYQYKMIRGIDLYTHTKQASKNHLNIEWRYEEIIDIQSNNNTATVTLESEELTADYIFNSILFNSLKSTRPLPGEDATSRRGQRDHYLLLQHFTGWLIRTQEPVFNPGVATFMDFRVSQQHGTTFIYLMPTSTTTALVEYTLFTESVLPAEAYETALKEYIASYLHIDAYTIEHKESGVIPMTNKHFPLQENRIIYMGVAGGQVKGSSGYAFQFIQKRTEEIVQLLIKNKGPFTRRTFSDRKFHLYDSVLLNVLHNRKMEADEIFARIFRKNPPERVLQFLDNETGLFDDLKIMQSVPASVFFPAALKEMLG